MTGLDPAVVDVEEQPARRDVAQAVGCHTAAVLHSIGQPASRAAGAGEQKSLRATIPFDSVGPFPPGAGDRFRVVGTLLLGGGACPG